MATFFRHYLTSELLELLKRGSLLHYYWSYNDGLYRFYFVDARRHLSRASNGLLHFCCHKANYYRLRNKINYLPFRLDFLSKYGDTYAFDLVPDSCFINDGADYQLKELNTRFDGNLFVNVVVI